MTAEDMKMVTFASVKKGYNPEDVDDFLAQAAKALEDMTAERDAAIAAKANNENKMMILAQKVEEYRGEENTLKTALINAQRMGETVVHEAKQKAESILRDATGQTELIRQKAEQDVANEQQKLVKMKEEVVRFKDIILTLYKQHIESLSGLDEPIQRANDFLEENGYTTQPEVAEAPADVFGAQAAGGVVDMPVEEMPAGEEIVAGEAQYAPPEEDVMIDFGLDDGAVAPEEGYVEEMPAEAGEEVFEEDAVYEEADADGTAYVEEQYEGGEAFVQPDAAEAEAEAPDLFGDMPPPPEPEMRTRPKR